MRLTINRQDVRFYPDSKRVIARFFDHGEIKAKTIITKISSMNDEDVDKSLNQVLREFSKRHRNITRLFEIHFDQTFVFFVNMDIEPEDLSVSKRLLIGAYFTMEYSIESTALFNPSIVEHPDQSSLEEGQKRIILSFRATGESHISSIVFRSGILDKNNNLSIDPRGNYISEAEIKKEHTYEKTRFAEQLNQMRIQNGMATEILNRLGKYFTYTELKEKVTEVRGRSLNLDEQRIIKEIMWLARSHYELLFSRDTDISERVIFPSSSAERNGIEDARFVKFSDENGDIIYYATYTAYDGFTILPRLIETKDFFNFKIMPLHGEAARDKNFALFPRKIKGKYYMLSRFDGISHFIMSSDDITVWETAKILQEPVFNWELVQVGNGGSPIETEEGWLVITHGVGPMRKYCLGALLLDLENPGKVIGHLREPLLVPNEDEREGYVPNVVYTCGVLKHNDDLIIPYAVSDYASSIASINIDKLLSRLSA
ncbi:MAG: glycoside hydrolase family 130 protein [Ignavibacteriae bacterium]|jgi:predicted GH43/DUF377 family glycosyl hydrolase|nr:glycoside hydrolase family 130 protein [Ignavibacteriota bacterium]